MLDAGCWCAGLLSWEDSEDCIEGTLTRNNEEQYTQTSELRIQSGTVSNDFWR